MQNRSLMREVEDYLNSLSDSDWAWWPLFRNSPPQDREIDNLILLKLSLMFGSLPGIFALVIVGGFHIAPITPLRALIVLVGGMLALFLFYKLTFAYCWNRRARRLRGEAIHPSTQNRN